MSSLFSEMDTYKFNLNTYATPPSESYSLSELERLCEERLHLYKIMDEASNLDYKPNTRNWEKYVEKQVEQRRLATYAILLKSHEVGLIRARKHDHVAHWLLSLCYCQSKLLRSFFMNCELNWFTMLYKRTTEKDLDGFFESNNFKYSRVGTREKLRLKKQLLTCRRLQESDFNTLTYYKVKFGDVTNLVAARRVFICRGVAYFPGSDLIYCIKNQVWEQWNKQLLWTSKVLPTNIKEERLENFLKDLSLVTPHCKRYSDKQVGINPDNIDEVARTHFPLCMKTIHSALRRDHHLKYDCKMQYGVFLKWVGLSFKHAMELWKSEFTKKMSSDWFDRKYSYLFKHQYGLVGGMIQYNPYTCKQILNSCPGPGQHHGCPFKHWSSDKLLQRCQEDGFDVQELNELRQLVVKGKYTEACMEYFAVTHKMLVKEKFKGPNEYFEASYEFEDSLSSCLNNIFEEY